MEVRPGEAVGELLDTSSRVFHYRVHLCHGIGGEGNEAVGLVYFGVCPADKEALFDVAR